MELMLLKPPSGGLLVRYASDAQRTIVGEALGLASIAANTRAAGISTDYLDAYLEDLTVEATVARILATAPRVLGILVRYPFVRIVREITGPGQSEASRHVHRRRRPVRVHQRAAPPGPVAGRGRGVRG